MQNTIHLLPIFLLSSTIFEKQRMGSLFLQTLSPHSVPLSGLPISLLDQSTLLACFFWLKVLFSNRKTLKADAYRLFADATIVSVDLSAHDDKGVRSRAYNLLLTSVRCRDASFAASIFALCVGKRELQLIFCRL